MPLYGSPRAAAYRSPTEYGLAGPSEATALGPRIVCIRGYTSIAVKLEAASHSLRKVRKRIYPPRMSILLASRKVRMARVTVTREVLVRAAICS